MEFVFVLHRVSPFLIKHDAKSTEDNELLETGMKMILSYFKTSQPSCAGAQEKIQAGTS
jgi:hypothetical protein